MDDIRKRRTDGIRAPAPRPVLKKIVPPPPLRAQKETPVLPAAPEPEIFHPQIIADSSPKVPPEFVKKENSWASHLKRIPSVSRPFAKEMSQEKTRFRMIRFGIFSGVLVGIVFLILLSTIFARATIRVKPHTQTEALKSLQVGFDVSASGLAIDQRVVPVEKLSFEHTVSQNFQPTGKPGSATASDSRVRGQVRIYNNFSTIPQTLVATTRLLSETGVVFRLQKNVVVPGQKLENGKLAAQFVDAEIAVEGTTKTDVAQGAKFSIPGFAGTPKADKFYAVALAAFQTPSTTGGGTVTEDDRKKASEAVTKQVFDEIDQEIKAKTPQGFVTIQPLREIQITTVSVPDKNTRADSFRAEATAVGQAFLFRQEDVLHLMEAVFTQDANNTRELIGDSIQLNYRVLRSDFQSGHAEVFIDGQARSKYVLSPEEIRAIAAGKKEGTLSQLFSARTDMDEFQLSFFPPWRLSTPVDPKKIKIVVEEP